MIEILRSKPEVLIIVLAIIVIAGQACSNSAAQPPHKSDPKPAAAEVKYPRWDDTRQVFVGQPEVLYDGHIRQINWEERSFVYESGWGYIKVIGPICGRDMLPMWQNMHVNEINFHWENPREESGCFDLDYVGHQVGVSGE